MGNITLNTSELKRSESNVRSGHSKEDIYTMATSIKNRGIINPPSVAKNGDGRYEVIAGQLRVAGAIAAGLKQIECIDVTNLTVQERVDISLSENVHRKSMTEIELFKAFDQLFRAGMSVEEIGSRFDKKEREVQQVLAIGGLPKKLLDAAERGDIRDRTLQALAIAPKGEVRRYMKLKVADRPNDWDIQKWLAGADGMFMAKFALFDLELYTGASFNDLFADEDELWLTDGSQFWELQTAALEAKLEDFSKKGWSFEQIEYWQAWAYEKTAKKKGGKVFWSKDDRTGAIEFHVGYTRLSKAGKTPTKEKDKKKEAKPEISNAFDNFMAETRHAALQAYMVQNNRVGLEGTLGLLLKQADNISFRSGGMQLSDAYSDSLHSGDDFIYVHDAYTDMLTELGLKLGHTWDIDLAKLVLKFDPYTSAQLTEWIILTTAYQWEMVGKDTTDKLGKALEIEQVTNWKADDAFWDGIKNKATLIKIAKENSIAIDAKATTKVIRSIVKSKTPLTWRPSWLKF